MRNYQIIKFLAIGSVGAFVAIGLILPASLGFGEKFPIFVAISLLIFALFVGLTFVIIRGGSNSRKIIESDIADAERSIYPLSYNEARERAKKVLDDQSLFHCVLAVASPETSRKLPADIKELFTRYAKVITIDNDEILSADDIGDSKFKAGYTRIGVAYGEEVEIAVSPNEERIYELDSASRGPKDLRTYPSIHHFLLMKAELMRRKA